MFLVIEQMSANLTKEEVDEVRMSCSLLRDFHPEDLYRDTEEQQRPTGNNKSLLTSFP